jgi:molybdopterin synthase sulfur carrier subunit
MTVVIKFIGSLRHATGASELRFDAFEGHALKDLINSIIARAPAIERSLLDKQSDDVKPNALMMVNGKEISVLSGLDTRVNDGDEVVFIPVIHGG